LKATDRGPQKARVREFLERLVREHAGSQAVV